MIRASAAKTACRSVSICWIDVEASSLEPGGFPVEVAWSLPGGTVHSAMIAPAEGWCQACSWDPLAEQLHGLSRTELASRGILPWRVARQLNEGLAGEWVYCDALAFDRAWIDQIFDAAGIEPQFRLADAIQLLAKRLGEPAVAGLDCYETLLGAAMRRRPELQSHRATDDVRLLQEMLELATSRTGDGRENRR